MNKFPVSLLRQMLGCMQDGLPIRVTAQKFWIAKSSLCHLSQMELGRGRGISNLDKKARITRPAPLI